MTAVRAVLLDLGDTLFRLRPLREDVSGYLQTALADAGLAEPGVVAGQALAAVRTALDRARETGATAEVSVADTVLARLAAAGVQRAPEAAFIVERALGECDVERFTDGHLSPPVLRELRALGMRLVGVSNTVTPPHLIERSPVAMPSLAELDACVFSAALGVRKPGREIYETALRLAGVDAGEAIFVGDRVREDVLGPRAVGIRAVLTHQFRAEDVGGADPLAVIPTLADLLPVLRSPRGR